MGLTVLDAGVIIGVLDGADQHHRAAVRELSAAVDDGSLLAVPASAYAEVLLAPARRGADARRVVDDFLADLPASWRTCRRTSSPSRGRSPPARPSCGRATELG